MVGEERREECRWKRRILYSSCGFGNEEKGGDGKERRAEVLRKRSSDYRRQKTVKVGKERRGDDGQRDEMVL
jgi:hypothetical protein